MVDTPVVTPPPASPPAASAPASPPAPALRTSRSRYILVVLLPVAALVASFFWLFTVDRVVSASTDLFSVGSLPGQMTVSAHPDTWYIYATGGSTIESIQVTDPNGQSIPAKASSAGTYMSGGRDFHAVGQFTLEPGQIGDFRIAVTGSDPFGDGRFSVGSFSVNGFQWPQFWAIGALVVVNFGAAVAIAVAPVVRSRRTRRVRA